MSETSSLEPAFQRAEIYLGVSLATTTTLAIGGIAFALLGYGNLHVHVGHLSQPLSAGVLTASSAGGVVGLIALGGGVRLKLLPKIPKFKPEKVAEVKKEPKLLADTRLENQMRAMPHLRALIRKSEGLR